MKVMLPLTMAAAGALTGLSASAQETKPANPASNAKTEKHASAHAGQHAGQHTANKVAANKPETKPGWVVVEEWVLWPLHREPHHHLAQTAEALRAGDEKKAADELAKAISWLRITDAHATVEGRYQLVQARERLEKIEADLRKGNVVDVDRLSKGIASAYHSIANEHYLKAKEHHVGSAGNKDSNDAAKHIIAAGLYLQEAARSAEHEFGKDVNESLAVLNEKGKTELSVSEFNENFLAEHLRHIGDGLQKLGAELQQP